MRGVGTYNLGHTIHSRMTLFVVGFEPENECSEGLTPKRLHCLDWLTQLTAELRRVLTEDESEQQGLPAEEVSENDFGGVRLAFRCAANTRHSRPGKFEFLKKEA